MISLIYQHQAEN